MAILENGDQRCSLAVHADDIGLRREAVAHMRHIPHVHHRAVYLLDREIIQSLDGQRRTVGRDLVLVAADFERA